MDRVQLTKILLPVSHTLCDDEEEEGFEDNDGEKNCRDAVAESSIDDGIDPD